MDDRARVQLGPDTTTSKLDRYVFTLACSAMLESINSWDRCFAKDSSASFYQQLDGLTVLQ